jgi:hypothetical protein
MKSRLFGLAAIVALTLALAACGTRTDDRVGSGAAIGAGTGAAIGAVFFGIGAIPGALIGAGVGAGTGAVASARQVDLGKPLWRTSASN